MKIESVISLTAAELTQIVRDHFATEGLEVTDVNYYGLYTPISGAPYAKISVAATDAIVPFVEKLKADNTPGNRVA